MLLLASGARACHSGQCRRFCHIPSLRRGLLTLAIETSCDDTCVAILSKHGDHNGTSADLLFNKRVTAQNTGKGGIVPNESLASHHTHLSALLETALPYLPDAKDTIGPKTVWLRDERAKQKPDFLSVTRGPGMAANLGLGLATAKGLAGAWQIPMVGVHHMQAHALTPRLVSAMRNDIRSSKECQPSFPFLTLLISGGHTMLLHSKGLLDHDILATTRDNAIGDELDKCGRLILPPELRTNTPDTSFGKYLSAYAFADPKQFSSWKIPAARDEEVNKVQDDFSCGLKVPMATNRDLSFSFASIASQVERVIVRMGGSGKMHDQERRLLARATLGTAFEHLGSRTIIALEKLRIEGVEISNLVVSGGVAANDFLRHYLRELLNVRSFANTKLVFPPVEFCTDNAAMIAWAGMEMFEAGYTTDLASAPVRKWSMDGRQADGGILGIGGWLRR
jgi:N6-L-threonylcarbamoyladenine synthase